jgi:uncharacterized membrane protein
MNKTLTIAVFLITIMLVSFALSPSLVKGQVITMQENTVASSDI